MKNTGTDLILAERSLKVEGKVIIALGDSYASGEGNPDQPTIHSDLTPKAGSGNNFFLSKGDNWINNENGPIWMDRTCHRSLLSNQFKVALRYAKENPRQRVVFASFACSGAEILQGLLQPQKDLPHKDKELKFGQLASAVNFLCAGDDNVKNDEAEVERDLSQATVWRWIHNETFTRVTCKDSKKFRKPDLILLSIGGNDIGFGPMGTETFSPASILPFGISFLKVLARLEGAYISPEKAQEAVNDKLPKLYRLLNEELIATHLVDKHSSNVLQMNYPDILLDCDDKCYLQTGLGFQGIKFMMDFEPNIPYVKEWLDDQVDMSMSNKEAFAIRTKVINTLRKKVTENKEQYKWQIADLDEKELRQHSICALDNISGIELTAKETFRFPYRENNDDSTKWRDNFKPSDWQPYAPGRQRWFNTGNDAIMKASTRTCPEHYQLLRDRECSNEMLRGTLHPSLAFHAKSADVMYSIARGILQAR